MTEIGIESATTKVLRTLRKKKSRIKTAKMRANHGVMLHIFYGAFDELRLIVSQFKFQIGIQLLRLFDFLGDFF